MVNGHEFDLIGETLSLLGVDFCSYELNNKRLCRVHQRL